MVDIATIGYAADTSGLKPAEAALDSLTAKSKATAAGMDALSASADKAKTSVGGVAPAATAADTSVGGLGEQVSATQEKMKQGASASQRYAAELKAAQASVQASLAAAGGAGGQGAGPMLDQLRARFAPLFAAQQQYRADLALLNATQQAGALTTKEYAAALASLKNAFAQQVTAINAVGQATDTSSTASKNMIAGMTAATNSSKLMIQGMSAFGTQTTAATGKVALARHELINLSRQFQDVGVSLASGQSPIMVLIQQGAQIADVFASSQGTVGGFFKQTASWLGGFLTAGRIAFAGVTAAVAVATSALIGYASAQKQVDLALSGAGRASGATRADINQIAAKSASPLGLSVAEGREFASTLASTGRIGVEVMTRLTKLGHDFATTLGVESKEAAAVLARSFSDPVAGAEQLNQKLGFLDAAQQRQIKNLTEQNRITEAQKILLAGIESSILKASQVTGFWAATWNAISNAVSNAYDGLGGILSRATGIGATLDDQYTKAKNRVLELRAAQQLRTVAPGPDASASEVAAFRTRRSVVRAGPTDAEMEAAIAQEKKYADAIKARADAAEAARLRMESFKIASTALNLLPEIEQIDKLRNTQDLLVRTMIDVETTGGPLSPILERLGITYSQLAEAVQKSSSQFRNFKNEFESAVTAQRVQLQALTAFSPQAKGEVAYQQRLNAELRSGTDQIKAQALAEGDRAIAIKSVGVALSEAQRERLLAADQAKASADLELGLIGKQIGQQTQLRADLQARQQLEQEASRNRTGFDEAEYARLQKKNEILGQIAQKNAEARLADQLLFERQQLGRTDIDATAASTLRSAGIDANSATGQALAQQIKFNEQLKITKSLLTDVSTSFVKDFKNALMDGANAWQALQQAGAKALNSIADKLIDIAMKDLVAKAFAGSGSSGGLGSLFSLLGGGSGAGAGAAPINVVGGAGDLAVPTFFDVGGYTGNGPRSGVAGYVHGQEFVINAEATRQHMSLLRAINDNRAPGYADGGYVGTPPPPSLSSGGGSSGDVVHVTFAPQYNVKGSGEEIAMLRLQMERDQAEFSSKTIKAVQDAKSRRVRGV